MYTIQILHDFLKDIDTIRCYCVSINKYKKVSVCVDKCEFMKILRESECPFKSMVGKEPYDWKS